MTRQKCASLSLSLVRSLKESKSSETKKNSSIKRATNLKRHPDDFSLHLIVVTCIHTTVLLFRLVYYVLLFQKSADVEGEKESTKLGNPERNPADPTDVIGKIRHPVLVEGTRFSIVIRS